MTRLAPCLGDGFGVALATPMHADGALDEAALAALTSRVVAGGADFVVVLGSTGEAALLSDDERTRVVEIVAQNRGDAALVVGAGGASTAEAQRGVARARALDADALLVAAPCYTKPSQDGIVAHFCAVAEAARELPIIAYNVPSRTGVNVRPETLQALWQLPTVVAVKESSGDLSQIARIAAELPEGRALLAGDDGLVLPTLAVGGVGAVSVAGNVVPEEVRDLLRAMRASDLPRARCLDAALRPLVDALSLEPNPTPVKAALELVGIGRATVRLPLLAAGATTRRALARALQQLQGAALHV